MDRRGGLFVLLTLVAGLALTAAPVGAAGASCWSDLSAGPPGTVFSFYCSGFTPFTYVNAYVVEPDGRAVSAAQITGFQSNADGSAIKVDADGNVWFSWHSQDGSQELLGGGAFAHQLGNWTWVVHELGPANSVTLQGQVTVRVEGKDAPQAGASLLAYSSDWQTWWFSGTGYAPDETVNIWVSLPPTCSGRANVESASADEPYIQGLFDGFLGPSNVKANAAGAIVFSIVFTSRACLGHYATTAYAPGSGAGAIVWFEVRGDQVATSDGVWLTTSPDAVDALNPYLTLLGYGFDPFETVNCWTTRPDGRAFPVGNVTTDASGSFALDIHASGGDSFAPYASEEPGLWSATCRAPAAGHTAITSFMVQGLTSDP